MPSGPKKRKAAKRKNQKEQDSSTNPNPSPNSQENEKEKSLVEIEEDEGEEIFGTPRSQPEMPMFVFEPDSVYFSIGSVKNERRDKVEGLSELISKGLDLEMAFKDTEPVIAAAENSIGLVLLDGSSMERDENLETEAFDEEVRHDVSSLNEKEVKVDVNSEKGSDVDGGESLESGIYNDDEVLKETKLDFEMPFKDAKDDLGSKEVELDEFVHVIEEESSIERVKKLGTEEDRPTIEQSVLFDEEMTPKASIEVVDVSSSNEKEVKVVPWLDEELLTDNGDVDINVDAINYEKVGDDDGNKSLEREFDEDDVLKEIKLDGHVHDIEKDSKLETEECIRSLEQSVPLDEEMAPKASSEAVDVSSSNEREVKVVLLTDEEFLLDNGDVDVSVDIINYEKGGDDDGSKSLEREFDKDGVLKETKSDGCVHDIKKELKLETEAGLRSVEQSVLWDEEMTPKATGAAVDVSSSNEREVKLVPWPDEELLSDNGDADVNVDVVNYEKGADNDGDGSMEREFDKDDNVLKETKLDECVHDIETEEKLETVEDLRSIEKYVPLDEEMTPRASIEAIDVSLSKEKEMNMEIPTQSGDMNVDGDGRGNLEREFQKDEDSESILVNLCEENKQPVTEKSKDLLEPLVEIMPRRDVYLTNNKLGKSVEKSAIPVEKCVLIMEEETQGSKASNEFSETLVGVNNASFHGRVKETEELSPDAEKTEIVRRNEVGHDPLVVRRATLWNCCGLLEVLTSSDR